MVKTRKHVGEFCNLRIKRINMEKSETLMMCMGASSCPVHIKMPCKQAKLVKEHSGLPTVFTPHYKRLESILHFTGPGGEQNRLVSAMPLYSVISDHFSFSGRLL